MGWSRRAHSAREWASAAVAVPLRPAALVRVVLRRGVDVRQRRDGHVGRPQPTDEVGGLGAVHESHVDGREEAPDERLGTRPRRTRQDGVDHADDRGAPLAAARGMDEREACRDGRCRAVVDDEEDVRVAEAPAGPP